MKKIIFIISLLTVSSCSSLMKSEQELITTGAKSPVYCSTIDFSVLKAETEKYLNKCFVNTRKIIMNGSQVSVDYSLYKKEENDATKYILVAAYQYYNRAIFITRNTGNSCASEVQVIAPNKNAGQDSFWFKPFKTIAEGKEPGCAF
jgi:hypothetical protein